MYHTIVLRLFLIFEDVNGTNHIDHTFVHDH